MAFLIIVLIQVVLVPLIAFAILHQDRKRKRKAGISSSNMLNWKDVELVDLPAGITTMSASKRRASRR